MKDADHSIEESNDGSAFLSKSRKNKLAPFTFKDEPQLPIERRVVYRETHPLCGKPYAIEISFSKHKIYVVAMRKNKHFIWETFKKQGKKLVSESGGYENLAR